MMISPKKLIKMARKWQRLAAIQRKRIVGTTMTTVADEGHFVVYTVDEKRWVFPIEYLNNYIFRELLILSEEEFGLPSNGPITFPCDSVFMDYATKLIQQRATEDMGRALIMSIATSRCSLSSSFHQQETSHQLLPCVF